MLNNAIFKYVVENGYGYPVESIPTTTPIAQLSLSNGDVDVWLELWQQNWIDNYREITADGSIVNMGMIYEGGPQFWIIPQSVSDEHNIKTIDDLKANWQLFEDPEDPTKGAFINCPAGWQCAEINRTKVAAYGLDETFNVVEPGSPAALAAGLSGPALRGDPVFGYYWAPTALMGRFDWQIIEEPTYTDECWAEVAIGQNDKDYVPAEACAYETLPIDKGINRGMLKKAPDVVQMMNRMNVGLQPINVTAAWAIEADIQGEWEKAAIYYLENYEERCGLAVSNDLRNWEILTPDDPCIVSPHATGSLRYVDAQKVGDEIISIHELTRPCGAHEMRLSRFPADGFSLA